MQPFDSVTVLENAVPLDRVISPVRAGVRRIFGSGKVRDALHGVWLGHPVHPTLVQVALGSFSSATVLDLIPGNERAARTLIVTGLVSAAPAATTGWADWSEMHEQQQRVGLVHAALNFSALAAYTASLAARQHGNEARGKVWAVGGLSLLGLAGFLGGHLSFRQAAGANHGEDVPHLVKPGWQDLCALDDLAGDGEPQQVMLGSVPLLVVHQDDRIDVLSDRCSHLAGPLHEGGLTDGGACIECPWHGSVFSLDDGAVRRGPATAPVHAFDVKVADGRLLVRLPGAG
ncbi:MAG: Rieske 2Fe-2S domain-containing protein [Actinomycetes bacterium]